MLMPTKFPAAWLAMMAARGRLSEVAEYRLSVHDVARACKVHAHTVRRWTEVGSRGYVLAALRIGDGARAPYAYRLYDVLRFAERTGRHVFENALPPEELSRWRSRNGVLPVSDDVLS